MSAGSWLWIASVLVAAIAMGAVWMATRRTPPDRRRPRRAIAACSAVLTHVLVFVLVPELALSGWMPGTTEQSLCDESPGSGCGACTAELEAQGLPTDTCYRRPRTALAIAVASLGPVARSRPREEIAHRCYAEPARLERGRSHASERRRLRARP